MGDESLISVVMIVMGCCITVYVLAFSFLLPALLIHYARTNSFAALFQVSEVFKLATQNIGDYLLAWVTGLVAGGFLVQFLRSCWYYASFPSSWAQPG